MNLDLTENPVTNKEGYREKVFESFPTLNVGYYIAKIRLRMRTR